MADYKLSKYSAMTAKEFSSSPTKMDILAKDKKITAFIQIIEQPFAAKSSRKKRRCDWHYNDSILYWHEGHTS